MTRPARMENKRHLRDIRYVDGRGRRNAFFEQDGQGCMQKPSLPGPQLKLSVGLKSFSAQVLVDQQERKVSMKPETTSGFPVKKTSPGSDESFFSPKSDLWHGNRVRFPDVLFFSKRSLCRRDRRRRAPGPTARWNERARLEVDHSANSYSISRIRPRQYVFSPSGSSQDTSPSRGTSIPPRSW